MTEAVTDQAMDYLIEDRDVIVVNDESLSVLRTLPDNSIDAVVTDPPYGLEFMGKEWDSFRGEAWRNSAGMTSTGYTDGGKRLARPSFGGGDTANPTCATCGGRKRGAKKCSCGEPDWRVKGKPLDQRDNNAAQMRAFQEWCEAWARECLRVLKPGGHMLAFGGTRTWHRLACAIEDAGFEVRDSIAWLYGQGFPKSLNVATAVERTRGLLPDEARFCEWMREHSGLTADDARRLLGSPRFLTGLVEIVNAATKDNPRMGRRAMVPTAAAWAKLQPHLQTDPPAWVHDLVKNPPQPPIQHPGQWKSGKGLGTVGDNEWQGWGTALKPAHEPIVVARKPLSGTVAQTVLTHGTGALNIDGCRVGDEERTYGPAAAPGGNAVRLEGGDGRDAENARRYAELSKQRPPITVAGRWPANVVLSEDQAAALDEQSGESASRIGKPRGADSGDGWGMTATGAEYDDFGGASRFFFIAREDNNPCPSTSAASTAANPSSRPSEPGDSAPRDAATTACPDGERLTDSPSTNGTPSASRLNGASGTTPILTTGNESSPESPHARPTPTRNPARSVGPSEPTDTTMTTTSPSTSDGSADHTTSSTTPTSAPGVPLDELGSRFTYVAKANKKERPTYTDENGKKVSHPTVKPLTLMRWLVRMVTPPNGLVLDPFAGSGSTGEACLLEGKQALLIERDVEYLPLIAERIRRFREGEVVQYETEPDRDAKEAMKADHKKAERESRRAARTDATEKKVD